MSQSTSCFRKISSCDWPSALTWWFRTHDDSRITSSARSITDCAWPNGPPMQNTSRAALASPACARPHSHASWAGRS